MNVKLLFLCTLIIISTRVQAQVETQFGIKGGLNYVNNIAVNWPNDDTPSSEYRFSYHIGGFLNIGLTDKLSLNTDLLFSNKGYKGENTPNTQPEGEPTVHFNYLNLPILMGYTAFDKITLQLGPEFGYLLSARSKFDTETIDIKHIWDNELDVGISAGLIYPLIEKIIVGVRYTHGLSSVIKGGVEFTDPNRVVVTEEDVKFQNRTFQLSLSYRLK